jgi:outer membrane protein assembly factor BamD
MHHLRPLRLVPVAAAMIFAGCHQGFQPRKYGSDLSRLYTASVKQLQSHNWDNAVTGFERLTIELPARDTLLPLSVYHLAQAHEGKEDYLLAAQSYTRVAESYPLDSLADDALLHAGLAYGQMWRRPELDPQYGEMARTTLQTVLQLYPDSPLAPRAQKELDNLSNMFAQKIFENAMFYMRRKFYDSAIIYLTSVIDQYPSTPTAHDAMLRLAEAYRQINYRSDHDSTCATLHEKYPNDSGVREECGAPPAAPAAPVLTPGSLMR